jgi:formate hydrogenlyase subunit 3/multisubunit Na+/H+ antiporter MnhD subunit
VYFYYNPPYFFLVAGLLIGVTCGAAFGAVLKQAVGDWYQKKSTRSLATLRGIDLQLPFFGICAGICIFLASGLGIFGFTPGPAYAFAALTTFLCAGLIWRQLKGNLALLESGQPRAFDIDIFE